MRFAMPTLARGDRLIRTADRAHRQLIALETDVRTLATPLLVGNSLRVLRGYCRTLTRLAAAGAAAEMTAGVMALNTAVVTLGAQLSDGRGRALGGQALVALHLETALAFLSAYAAVDQLRGTRRITD